MSEKVELKIMRCPTCGANLKAENNTESIICVYCGNTVVPVTEATPIQQTETVAGFSGVLKVEGIKTSSSALAYIEQFFEDYDWEAFAYAHSLSVAEIDKLADSLKVSSADDKNTWFVCFKAISVPFIHKIDGCKQILSTVIEEYKNDNLEAYSKFDAYKRIAMMITERKNAIVSNLEKYLANAAKYGASSAEVTGLNADIDSVKKLADINAYGDIKEIPGIKAFIEEKNAKITEELEAKGINAESEYYRAKSLIYEKNYVEALNVLLLLKGYSDTNELIEKIDKYYLISDVLEIEGKLYYFKKGNDEYNTLSLYPTVDGQISNKPIIRNIGQIITNHADILYYLDVNNKLIIHNLSTNTGEKIHNMSFEKKAIYVYGKKAFLLAENKKGKHDIVELDLITSVGRIVIEDVKDIVSLNGNKMVYTYTTREEGNGYISHTKVFNVEKMEVVDLGTNKISIEGFVDNYVVYTQVSPNDYNKNLYIKDLSYNVSEVLIEQNIFKFCGIFANKLFYYIGNSRNQSLININCDGTERRECPRFISDILFEQAGWLYFIRKAGYNSVLCKSHLDGSKFSIIATDIEKFIDIKNGYLYYINDVAKLVKVRMDGSNLQELCDGVETVLSVKEDKIIFVSVDEVFTTNVLDQVVTNRIKSIYAVDFSGSGKIKLAYNIKSAKEYDDNTVYYIGTKEVKFSDGVKDKYIDELYKLDVETYQVEKLLELEEQEAESEGSCLSVFLTIAIVLLFLIGMVGFFAEEAGVGLFGLIAGFIFTMIKLGVSANKKG